MYQPDDRIQVSEPNDWTIVEAFWTFFDVFRHFKMHLGQPYPDVMFLFSSLAVARNTNADEGRSFPSKIWSCLMMYQPDDLMQISELNDGTLVDGLWTLFDVFSKL